MNVNGIQPPVAPTPVEPLSAAAPVNQAQGLTQAADTVEISTVARLAAKVADVPEVRAGLVERVKAEIAAGTYETPERIDLAVSRLMDELFPDL